MRKIADLDLARSGQYRNPGTRVMSLVPLLEADPAIPLHAFAAMVASG